MRHFIAAHCVRVSSLLFIAALALAAGSAAAQSIHEAATAAPSSGRVSPQGEPGEALKVSGVVVAPDAALIAGASLYVVSGT